MNGQALSGMADSKVEMRYPFHLIGGALLTLVLTACAEPALVVGAPGPALAREEVVVYYIDRPRCNFETVAHLRVTGGYLSLQSMLDEMRQQAAATGASGVFVLETQQSSMKDFRGSAKAIRCLAG